MDIVTRFLADTTQMKDADRVVNKVGVTTEQTAKKVKNLGQNMRLARGPTSALSTTAGQLGVQFQDVAVQAQMGTDAVRIFSQQAPQILSVFGPKGAVLGALAAIGAVVFTTVVDAFSMGEKSLKSFADASKQLSDNIADLSNDTLGLAESLVELAEKSEAAAKLQIAIALEAADVAAQKARESFKRLGLEGVGMRRTIEGADQATIDFAVALENLAIDGRMTIQTVERLKRASGALGLSVEEIIPLAQQLVKATDPNADASALVEFGEILAGIAQKTDTGNEKFKTYILNLLDTALKAESAEEKAKLLAQAMTDLSGAVNRSDEGAIKFVERLKEQAAAIGKTRHELMLLQAQQIKDPVLREQGIAAAKQLIAEEKRLENIKKTQEEERKRKQAEAEAARERKRQVEERIRDMAAFRKMVADEAKAIDDANDAELQYQSEKGEIFRKELEDEIKAQEEHEEAKRILADEQRKLRNLEREAEEQHKEEMRKKDIERTANYSNALLAIEDKLMKGKTEKQKAAFRIGANLLSIEKRENAAKILSDSYTAAMSAYKSLAGIPIIGPALGAAAAGVIIAAGASYATQSLAGRALGGQVRAGESYVVGERGPEVLTMGSGGRITPNEKLGSAQQVVNKTANVTFQITAVDTSGFDQLLQSRRGQIVGMINSALNDQGKRAIA